MMKHAILITGCDTGFGFSLALDQAEKEADHLVLACCYQPESEGAKQLMTKNNIRLFKLDVTDSRSIEQLSQHVDEILEKENAQLKVLVNNAAALVFADATWQTRDMVWNQFAVNTIGCWEMSQVFAKHLIHSKGRLVNMISFCTQCPLPTLSVYCASKAGLKMLSDGMRMEMKKFGVDVILFNPGDYPNETPLCFGQEDNYEVRSSVNQLTLFHKNIFLFS